MKEHRKKLHGLATIILMLLTLMLGSICAFAKENKELIVIDPGCQAIENTKKESVGPGDWNFVAEDLVGAKGATTGNSEFDLNLKIALKTKKALEDLGYRVELTRTTNDVDMNNAERSMIANTMNADLYISIHSSSGGKKASGISVICETKDNPYNYGAYSKCRLLADTLKGCLEAKTLDAKNDVVETDELIGINWCQVPNAIIEVGNIKNSDDDVKLNDSEYQDKLADGITAGIDSYFAQR